MGMVKFDSKIPWKTRISRKNSAPYNRKTTVIVIVRSIWIMNESGLQHGLKNLCGMIYLLLFWSGESAIRNWQLKIKDLKKTIMAVATRTWHKWRFPEQNKSSAYVLCSLPIHPPMSMSGQIKLLKYVLECWSMLPNPPSPSLPSRRTCCKATCHSGSFFSLFWAQQVKEIFQNQLSHPFTCWIFKNSKQL